MAQSGWCSGPPGSEPPHRYCHSEVCTCECHDKKKG